MKCSEDSETLYEIVRDTTYTKSEKHELIRAVSRTISASISFTLLFFFNSVPIYEGPPESSFSVDSTFHIFYYSGSIGFDPSLPNLFFLWQIIGIMEFDVIYSDIDIYTVYTLHSFVTKLKKGYFIKQERRKLA